MLVMYFCGGLRVSEQGGTHGLKFLCHPWSYCAKRRQILSSRLHGR